MKKSILLLTLTTSLFGCKKDAIHPFTSHSEYEIPGEEYISYTHDGKTYRYIEYVNDHGSVFGSGVGFSNDPDITYRSDYTGMMTRDYEAEESRVVIGMEFYPVLKEDYENDRNAVNEAITFEGEHGMHYNNPGGFSVEIVYDDVEYVSTILEQDTSVRAEILNSHQYNEHENEDVPYRKVEGRINHCKLLNKLDNTDTLELENVKFQLRFRF